MNASDAENKVVNPESLHSAARAFFDLQEDLTEAHRPLIGSSQSLKSDMEPSSFTLVDRLIELTDEWGHFRVHRLKKHYERLGQFLVVHAEGTIEADEFSASDFSKVADPQQYPEASNSPIDTPAPGPSGEPAPEVG